MMALRRLMCSWRSKIGLSNWYSKVKELTLDNQNLVKKILECKDDQARAFNEANNIMMEATRLKYVSLCDLTML
jgi:hypothetical protein